MTRMMNGNKDIFTMAALLTKDEVITYAFTRKVDTVKIPDEILEVAQFRHLKPILGEDLYDLVVADPSSYSELVDYIKPFLAYHIKFYVLPIIWADISTTGVNQITGNNRVTGTKDTLETARASALETAQLHADSLTEYLDDNEDTYEDYSKGGNPENQVEILGGIIFGNDFTDDDYDYTQDVNI